MWKFMKLSAAFWEDVYGLALYSSILDQLGTPGIAVFRVKDWYEKGGLLTL
jgi:hypothetical protein